MRKLSIATVFVLMLVATAALFQFATPAGPERAAALAFKQLGQTEHLAGLLTIVTTVDSVTGHVATAPLTINGVFRSDFPKSGVPTAESVIRTGAGGAGETIINIRSVGGELFFEADKLPAASVGPVPLADLAGTWWHLDQKTFAKLLDERAGYDGAAAGDDGVGHDPATSWERVRELALGGGMFVASPTGTVVEKIDGVRAYKQVLGVQTESAKAFAIAFREAMLGHTLSADDAAAVRAAVETMTVRVTAWVSVRQPRLLQLMIELEDEGAARSILVSHIDTATAAGVLVPVDAKSFDDLARAIFLPAAGAPPTAPAAAGKAPTPVKKVK